MRRQMLLVALGGVALGACQPAAMTRQEIAVQEQNLQARLQGWAKAFSNRQRDSLATYYDQAGGLTMAWPDGERLDSWDEESAKQQEFFTEARQVNLVLQDTRVQILSPTAGLTTFRHAMDVIVGEVAPERRYFNGQGTLVWTRVDDKSPWLIHAGQVSETSQR